MDILEYGNPAARIVLLQPVDDHDLQGMQTQLAALSESTMADFRLLAFRVRDWNRELSPWPAPAVFGREAFGGGAAETLAAILSRCRDRDKTYYIGGYSLAGLFALWAACQTELFAGVAAASPSVWFPGFTDSLRQTPIRSPRVYLSLGDREERAKNPVMATVGDRIRQTRALLLEQRVDCVLEWNQGNHFKDPDLRTARAFAWLLSRDR